jgi:Flp pilus assembly pilin Flp
MINVVVTWFSAYIRREQGQDLIEYALLGGLIAAAIVAVIALGAMTGAIEDMATGIGDCIDFDDITNCDPT